MATNGMPRVQYDLIRLQGGLDQVTPTLSLPSGVARRAANFECSITGGYTRIAGYERYDGHPNPSDAIYTLLTCALTGAVAVGNTLVGMTSAATGKVIVSNGSTIVLTRVTGDFVASEGIKIGATQVGTITSLDGVSTDGETDAQYLYLAAEDYRADISALPGSGRVLGVSYYDGVVYAWRNNSGGTAAIMYKSTSSGWTAVTLQKELKFSNGIAAFTAGTTVTGQTSAATGVISKVILESGAWSTSNATGYLLLSSTTGTFIVGENLRVSGAVHAHAASVATQISFAPGGHFETVVANFGGTASNNKLYGCDGKSRAFEFDGTLLAPINSTMPTDTPNKILVHKQHLFLSFDASLQFSAIANPFQWSPVLGAGELAMNSTITNLVILPGNQASGAMAVYTRNDTSVLYGTSSANFQLVAFNTGTGAIDHSAQNMDQTYVLDDRGVMSLGTSLNYGNFEPASLTMNIRPFVQIRRNLASASSVNREKGQYRLFFSDGYGLYMTILNGKILGSMPVQFPNAVRCAVEGESPDGSATSFFGSDNGMVYRLDAGTSFDGSAIPADFNLVFNSTKSPRTLKRYRKASLEMTGDSYASISFAYDLGYRTNNISQVTDQSYSSDLRSAYWDELTWDRFIWDGAELTPTEIGVNGTAENMAIRVSSTSAILKSFTVNSIIVHYTLRRGIR